MTSMNYVRAQALIGCECMLRGYMGTVLSTVHRKVRTSTWYIIKHCAASEAHTFTELLSTIRCAADSESLLPLLLGILDDEQERLR